MISLILSPAHLDDGGAGLQTEWFEPEEDLGACQPSAVTALSSYGSSLLRSLAGFAASIAWRGRR